MYTYSYLQLGALEPSSSALVSYPWGRRRARPFRLLLPWGALPEPDDKVDQIQVPEVWEPATLVQGGV